MTKSPLTVAVANMVCRQDKEANLAKMLRLTREAADRGAELVVFPEAALQGYPCLYGSAGTDNRVFAYHYKNAETVPGPATDAVAEAAGERGVTVAFGLTEAAGTLGPAGIVFNSLVVVGGDGVVGCYRKVHLGDVEKALWHAGDQFPLLETPAQKFAPAICFDLAFPESARTQALQGAELIIAATAWMAPGSANSAGGANSFDLFTRARALENQVWLVVSSQAGCDVDTGVAYLGLSRVIDPNGNVVSELADEDGVLIAEIDVRGGVLEARARGYFGCVFVRDRVPAAYGPLTDRSRYSPPPALGLFDRQTRGTLPRGKEAV